MAYNTTTHNKVYEQQWFDLPTKKLDSKLSQKSTIKFTLMTTRRKFTSAFKTKVVLAALKDQSTMAELAQKFGVQPNQIGQQKREFLEKSETVFEKGNRSKKSEAEQREEQLLKIIGQQKVELDFLKKAFS